MSPSTAEQAEPFIILVAAMLSRAARDNPALLDSDIHPALDSLVRMFKSLDSGIIFESKLENQYAAACYDKVIEYLTAAIKQMESERPGVMNNKMLLAAVVFLHRMAVQMDNGRPKGRAFIHWLMMGFEPVADEKPVEQQVIL